MLIAGALLHSPMFASPTTPKKYNILFTTFHMAEFSKKSNNGQTVAVLGAGISGLMDAFALHQAGFAVSVYAKGPDPRFSPKAEHYSSTHNGELGRFISRFEGEHYLGDSPMYPKMKQAFQKHVSKGGWLGKSKKQLTEFDKAWLKKRYAACDDVKALLETERFYVKANGKAMELWQELIREFPELFKNADLLNTGILRLYDNKVLLGWAINRHQKEGVLERALTPAGVAKDYPYFADAAEKGFIAGGLEAAGFSLNIHKFCQNLVDYLSAQDVQFNWRQNILGIQLSSKNLVKGLVTEQGLITARNYSINPGAYADESLFAGTPAAGKIAGVAGRWMFMPSPPSFKRPVKIHADVRKEGEKTFPIVDINLTHFLDSSGKEWLAVGGGYAYLGKPPFEANNPALALIDSENERIIKRFFGSFYEKVLKAGQIKKSSATCVRSFTYNDVPIMATMATALGGRFRVNVGTNTGTTTISPFTAQETVKALLG